MREALARTDHDFRLAEDDAPRARRARARATPKKTVAPRSFRLPPWAAPLARRPMRTILGASFAAILTGIVVNALALQHGPHPAPLFARVPAQAPRRASVPVPVPPVRPEAIAERHATAPVPPLVPLPQADRTTEVARAPAAAAHGSADPLGAFIRATTSADQSARVAAVQRAIAKLGLAPQGMKIDGIMGANTRQAVERYERWHNQPATGEITPHLVKMLETDTGLQIP